MYGRASVMTLHPEVLSGTCFVTRVGAEPDGTRWQARLPRSINNISGWKRLCARGVRVVNLSPESRLTAFPKGRLFENEKARN